MVFLVRNPEIFRRHRIRVATACVARVAGRIASGLALAAQVIATLVALGAVLVLYAAFFALPIAFVWLVLHLLGSPW